MSVLPRFVIRSGRIILPDKILENGTLVVEDGRIADILGPQERVPAGIDSSATGTEVLDASGKYVAPGFVELHIHGAGTLGFESEEEDALWHLGSYLWEKGVTTFVPTLQADVIAIGRLASALSADSRLQRRVPGLYVEGPFVNEKRRGGILPSTIRAPDTGYLRLVLEAAHGLIRLMTIAPELAGSDQLVRELVDEGVIPCLGHSDCTIDQIPRLTDGPLNITHLFNGMSPVSHKQSGLAMLPFLDPAPFFELNGDGVHLNSETIRLCWNHLRRDRMILISDAVISAGLGPGSYRYFGLPVTSGESGVRYEDGTLIGASCLLPEVVRRFIKTTGAPIPDAVQLATLNPCRLLGLDATKGSIAVGKDADLVLLDRNFEVVENVSMPGFASPAR